MDTDTKNIIGYRVVINIINIRIPEDEIAEIFRMAKMYTDSPYREDYRETIRGGEGYMEMSTEIVRTGRNIRLVITYSGEGRTFEEKSARMKNAVESGHLQRSLLYGSEADIHRPGAVRMADNVTATIMRIG